MNKKHQLKLLLILIGTILGSSITALVAYALRQNISLYYTPTQVFNHEAKTGHLIRVGGLVKSGSIIHHVGRLNVEFIVRDAQHEVRVYYHGILPDLFREQQGIVVKGFLGKDHVLQAQEVLAKHDENYMPAELRGTKVK